MTKAEDGVLHCLIPNLYDYEPSVSICNVVRWGSLRVWIWRLWFMVFSVELLNCTKRNWDCFNWIERVSIWFYLAIANSLHLLLNEHFRCTYRKVWDEQSSNRRNLWNVINFLMMAREYAVVWCLVPLPPPFPPPLSPPSPLLSLASLDADRNCESEATHECHE